MRWGRGPEICEYMTKIMYCAAPLIHIRTRRNSHRHEWKAQPYMTAVHTHILWYGQHGSTPAMQSIYILNLNRIQGPVRKHAWQEAKLR